MGFSGSVLCLGKITDETAEAIVFQNFQTPLMSKNVAQDHRGQLNGEHRATVKGGFLLPEEIRHSTRWRVRPQAETPNPLTQRNEDPPMTIDSSHRGLRFDSCEKVG